MFFLDLGDMQLVGASPEIHVRCEDRQVEIPAHRRHPAPGRDAQEDLALEKELLADPKERAEHVMLVDLARNDLGRVCDFGSVKVKDLMIIERYSHVMHIVSQVEGRAAPEQDALFDLRATFPAGTAERRAQDSRHADHRRTGADPRGPYGGCVGYFPSTATWIAASPSGALPSTRGRFTSRRGPASWRIRTRPPSSKKR